MLAVILGVDPRVVDRHWAPHGRVFHGELAGTFSGIARPPALLFGA